MEITPRTIAYDCILKTRTISEQELIDKYTRACERHNRLALFGQLRTALKNLCAEGKIRFVDNKVIRI